ncbi:nuclear transport factor 2 family protein [Thalassotalea sp. 1_MG-2023]|uniref:YybH family protein n=1 Tax=Thalassotalea sp. 1_MG-2023 TaxID=3062680 RepID=UPI0026E12789|nr:nuclear transport factor 2 family protein [Thalassotalea sp. 1_MG-2023]MDO6427333.1 nuclear transport factor 2 family protein [Thalassotalea sp. 1_MG-2023]
MKNLLTGLSMLLLLLGSVITLADDKLSDREAIIAQAKAFSQAYVDGDIETIMAIYSAEAKIVDVNERIESDIDAIRHFWTINPNNKWQIKRHKTESKELIIAGNMASDIGYYSGLSVHQDGREVKFGGAYVIVWRKIDGKWRMHLDMWNNIDDVPLKQ